MNSDNSSNSDPFDEILANYFQSVEQGETPTLEEWISRYPNYEIQLREFFADKQHIDGLAFDVADIDLTPAGAHAPTLPPWPGDSSHSDSWGDSNLTPERVRYFGDYELLEEIGRGGMGVVYKARQINLNRVVALKMILAGQLASPDDVRRFKSEAEAAAKLDHPGIVPIFEIGEHAGQHFFSMGFIDGTSLAQRLLNGPLPPIQAAELLVGIAGAVAFAHECGVIHRDLKPANVLLDRNGNARIVDFGLAKLVEVDSSLTRSGQVLGTPNFMAPEQVKGDAREIGPSTDVYALGAILYCSLTGRPPFQAATAMQTMAQVLANNPVPPRQLNSAIPKDLSTICLKCLEKNPRDRYSSAADFADDLSRFFKDEPIKARPIGISEKTRRWIRKNRRFVVRSSAIVLTTIAVVFASIAGINSYRKSQLGELTIVSHGQPLRGELFFDNTNDLACEPFTIPTTSPIVIKDGTYRLCVSAPNRIGHSQQVIISKKYSLTIQVELMDHTDWPPVALGIEAGVSACTPIPFSNSTDLVLVQSARGVERRRMDGTRVWEWIPGQNENSTQSSISITWRNWCNRQFEGVQSPSSHLTLHEIEDVDNDQEVDLILRSPVGPALIVFSGASGKVLWTFPRFSDSPNETFDKSSSETFRFFYGRGGFVGPPVCFDVNGDDINDIIMPANVGESKVIDPTNPGNERPTKRVFALSGKDGATLWNFALESEISVPANQMGMLPTIRLLPHSHPPLICCVDENRVVTLDVQRGTAVAAPLTLPSIPPNFAFADLDADSSDELIVALSAENSGTTLGAYSLPTGKSVFDFVVRFPIEKDFLQVVDLNSDGQTEILMHEASYAGYFELTLVSAADKKVTWRWKTQVDRSGHQNSNRNQGRAIAGPDIDADGFADIFVLTWVDEEFGVPHEVRVDALAGRSGQPIWQWSKQLQGSGFGPEVTLHDLTCWGQGPDGFPLVAIGYSSNQDPLNVLMLTAAQGLQWQTLKSGLDLVTQDFDRDGILDLMWTSGSNSWVSSRSNGQSQCFSRGTNPDRWKLSASIWSLSPYESDFDGDGTPDLFIKDSKARAFSGFDLRELWTSGLNVSFIIPSDRNFLANANETPDILTVTRDGNRLHLAAICGSSGRLVWRTPLTDIEVRKVEKLFSRRGSDISIAGLTVEKRSNNFRESIEFPVCLGISNSSGEIKWQYQIPCSKLFVESLQKDYADLNADGTMDLLIATRTELTESKIIAIDGATGKELWSKSEARDSEVFFGAASLGIADFNNDNQVDIMWAVPSEIGPEPGSLQAKSILPGTRYVVAIQWEVYVVNGADGNVRWQTKFAIDPNRAEFLVADVASDKSEIVFFDSGGDQLQFVRDTGLVPTSFHLTQPNANIDQIRFVDPEGDGIDACLVAAHNADGSQQLIQLIDLASDKPLWTWQTPGKFMELLRFEGYTDTNGELALIVDDCVYGINLMTGKTNWRCEGPRNSGEAQLEAKKYRRPDIGCHVLGRRTGLPYVVFQLSADGGTAPLVCRAASANSPSISQQTNID